ncbi:hypothetical protein [Streptomyces sp. NPDC086782]|uniref:hypothetical protein n=1 Tax=Streptomyces sp. NPDC086782 TaxID=3365757 RepID=UPI0037FDB5BA
MSALLTVDPATGLRRSAIRFPDGEPPLLDGCRWCGAPYWGHISERWAASRGRHKWEAPTEAQVAARRAARAALPVVPEETPTSTRCEAMNHNSVGTEVWCEIEDPDHDEDHDAGDGITWPRED